MRQRHESLLRKLMSFPGVPKDSLLEVVASTVETSRIWVPNSCHFPGVRGHRDHGGIPAPSACRETIRSPIPGGVRRAGQNS